MSYELEIISFEVIILNRVQIYDCEIGVVKCFDVYFPFYPKDAKSQSFIIQKFENQDFLNLPKNQDMISKPLRHFQ